MYVYRVPTFSGITWDFRANMLRKLRAIFSGNFNGIFKTHVWQNSNIRNRVFQKQHAIWI